MMDAGARAGPQRHAQPITANLLANALAAATSQNVAPAVSCMLMSKYPDVKPDISAIVINALTSRTLYTLYTQARQTVFEGRINEYTKKYVVFLEGLNKMFASFFTFQTNVCKG